MSEAEKIHSTGMDTHRLEALTDGIFAFAMTLLVLSINMPEIGKGIDIGKYLISQYQNFFNFALSFLLLSVFWLSHSQQYRHIKRTDNVTLWLNIFLLMFVVLMPFSTSLMNDQTSNVAAALFFNANMLVVSLILSVTWHYSLRKRLIDFENDKEHIIQMSRRSYYTPAIALFAVLLSFVSPDWSSLVYLLIPLMLLVPWPEKQKRIII